MAHSITCNTFSAGGNKILERRRCFNFMNGVSAIRFTQKVFLHLTARPHPHHRVHNTNVHV